MTIGLAEGALIGTILCVKPRPVPANVSHPITRPCRYISLAATGQQWLELERAMGIEPTAQAWEAWVLPLYDARLSGNSNMKLLR